MEEEEEGKGKAPAIVVGLAPGEHEGEPPPSAAKSRSNSMSDLEGQDESHEQSKAEELQELSKETLVKRILELESSLALVKRHFKAANEALKGMIEEADSTRRKTEQRMEEYELTVSALASKLALSQERSAQETDIPSRRASFLPLDDIQISTRELDAFTYRGVENTPVESPKPPGDSLTLRRKPKWSENVRKNRKLYIKISEAKELPKGQNVLRTGLVTEKWEALSTYVVVQIDDKEVARTDTLSKNYLWNQEFALNVDQQFEAVTFTVWSKAKVKAVFRDGALAQLRLKRDVIGKDQLKHEDWFPLYMAKKQKESLLGAVQLDINMISRPTEGLITLVVKVLSARNLGEKDDSNLLYPYVALHLLPDPDLKSTKQTQIQLDTFNPVFNETFTFTLEKHQIADSKLHVSIWNSNVSKTDRTAEHEFIGQTLIPLAELPIAALNGADDPIPDSSHFYALSGKSIPSNLSGTTNLLSSAPKAIKKTNSVVINFGKLTKAQLHLATLVRALSSFDPSDAIAHDYVALKISESPDITDCDQCGGAIHTRRQTYKCKVCGLVVHDCCRQLVAVECATAGSLRLSYRFYQETLLPYGAYNELLSLVTEEPLLVLHHASTVCEVDRLQELAQTCLNIFHSQGSAVRFLNQLVTQEVQNTKDPNTIFRGNSLATKCLDYFMKLLGRNYLFSVLKKPVDEIFSEKKNCELDPTRGEASKRGSMDWSQNKKNLLTYLRRIVEAIINSLEECPIPFREVFSHMQAEVAAKFPQEPNVRYIVVSGFIFLRFFCPAILGPKLFGLREDVPDQTIGRTLTMVAKVLQNLANIVDFGQKEPYLIDLNPFIGEFKEKMKMFIDGLSNNRESTMLRISELEFQLHHDIKVYEGVENLYKLSKDKKQKALVQKELNSVKEKLDSLKLEHDKLKKIFDNMPSSESTIFSEYDYIGKFNFHIESEMARLHGHLAAKREPTINLLESVDNPEYKDTAKKFRKVLDQLDELLESLQRTS